VRRGDGATGATVLHDFGGTVICSDRASSSHVAMPAATIARDDAAGSAVSVSEMASLLEKLVRV
jgi:two-component system chemotaxis response regulator CheB